LFGDEHLLAIDKPAGMPVPPTVHRSTVVKLLEAVRLAFQRLAHRLVALRGSLLSNERSRQARGGSSR
jgi:23S rRNA-/tRNA-specific pseudouridylate synthase